MHQVDNGRITPILIMFKKSNGHTNVHHAVNTKTYALQKEVATRTLTEYLP